jgi:hypothetical protein
VTGRPLDVLIGTWSGPGTGAYPTVERFGYVEEITFAAVPGKPFLAYQQRTRHATEDRPLHAEAGYWRWVGDGDRIEVVLAHPTGIAELLEGDLAVTGDGFELVLDSRTVALTTTAKDVRVTRRRFVLRGDELRYEVWMGAVGLPLQPHLEAVLVRRPAD